MTEEQPKWKVVKTETRIITLEPRAGQYTKEVTLTVPVPTEGKRRITIEFKHEITS